MSSKRSVVWRSLVAGIAVFSGQPLEAAGYPDKPVRVIVAYAAGEVGEDGEHHRRESGMTPSREPNPP